MSALLEPAAMEPFYATIGRLSCSFAALEMVTKSLLSRLASGAQRRPETFQAEMLVADFPFSMAIAKIQLLANELEEGQWKTHLLYAMECVSRLRVHRNYFVHGLIHLTENNGRLVGYIETVDTRKGFRETNEFVEQGQLEALREQVDAAASYVMAIDALRVWKGGWPGWEKLLDEHKPPLPEQLQKPHRFVIATFKEAEAKRAEIAARMEQFRIEGRDDQS